MKKLFHTLKHLMQGPNQEDWLIGLVTLNVLNLHLMKGFYTRVLGLSVLREEEGQVLLGMSQGMVPLLKLVKVEATKSLMQNRTYLLGFELPKPELVSLVMHQMIHQGQSILATGDDGYSLAFYLMDPEQNRLKFYALHDHHATHRAGGLYREGTRLEIPLSEWSTDLEGGEEILPRQTRINQVQMVCQDLEALTDQVLTLLPLQTTFDYVDGRANFNFAGEMSYILSLNDWNRFFKEDSQVIGLSQLRFFVSKLSLIEDLVNRLEAAKQAYDFDQGTCSFVLLNGVQIQVLVEERL